MTKDKTEKAIIFANTTRGKYIIGQALVIAIKELKKVEAPHTEVSNIADMEFLRDNYFSLYQAIEKARAEFARKNKKK